jgi:hypothetical protein
MADSFPSPIPSRPAGAPGVPGGGPGGVAGARGSAAGQSKSEIEFQALLERVEARAKKLATDAADVQAPEQLAQAMQTARESLDDVLSLKELLLEAYRAEQRRGRTE